MIADPESYQLLQRIWTIAWEADPRTGLCRYVSDQTERLGYPAEHWRRIPYFWQTVVIPEDRHLLTQLSPSGTECRVARADGAQMPARLQLSTAAAESDRPAALHGTMLIYAAERAAVATQAASRDELTGLPNRNLMLDRIGQAIALAGRSEHWLAVLSIDFDRFKLINDSLGHEIGDKLLVAASVRLDSGIREADTVARLGGDEFVILATGIGKFEDIHCIAQKILDLLAAPFYIDGHTLFLTVSIGVCAFPKDGADAVVLLKRADTAMYRAKEQGKNRYLYFSDEMNAANAHRLHLENELRLALEHRQLALHYQPQIDLDSGRIIGVEALARWRHPTLGWISPAEFIKIAEETALIVPLGRWVLETGCRQVGAWRAAGLPPLRMAINLSPVQFTEHSMADCIEAVLRETGLDPRLLELELTESLLMRNVEESIGTLRALRAMGICLAVDDFGTGYSSLSYLSRFPVTTVKIDQSFTRELTSDPNVAALVRSIISMAHELRLRVIAEGVETEGQLNFLANHRCNEVQGYFLGKPLPADEFIDFYRRFDRLAARRGGGDSEERRLLVVDDETKVVEALVRQLDGDGYRIMTATGGAEALEILARQRVGVIVSGQRMPGMSGVEFFRKVKDLYPATARIILSGFNDIQTVTDAINQGAIYKFLNKPWREEHLRDAVREAFQRYELTLENAALGRALEQANAELSAINRDLERRIAEKTRELGRGINMLQVSREILEHLPTAVIGIDDDGLIVMANRQANRLLASDDGIPLLSCEASLRLPAAALAVLADPDGRERRIVLTGGLSAWALCRTMGADSVSRGRILMLWPESGQENSRP